MSKKEVKDKTWIIPVAPGTMVMVRKKDGKSVTLTHELGTPYVAIQERDTEVREAAVRSGVFRYATPAEIEKEEI